MKFVALAIVILALGIVLGPALRGTASQSAEAKLPPEVLLVEEQNLDGSGFIAVHEQGVADVNVTNASLPVTGTVDVGNQPAVQDVNVVSLPSEEAMLIVPGKLEVLIEGDKLLSSILFATVAGLALTASAFAFTAAAVLEQTASRFNDQKNWPKSMDMSEASKRVLGAGISLIGGFILFVIGLGMVMGLDSWGEEALKSALAANDLTDAYLLEGGEVIGAGLMLLSGFILLGTGAGGLLLTMVTLRGAIDEELKGLRKEGVPGTSATNERLETLKALGELRKSGVLTEEEFEEQKKDILAK